MASLRVGAAVKRLNGESRAPSARAPGMRTPGTVVRAFARVVLWCLVAVLLIRGAADLWTRSAPATATATGAFATVPVAWPDDEARAFAVEFTRAYLSYSPRQPERYANVVRAFVSPEL